MLYNGPIHYQNFNIIFVLIIWVLHIMYHDHPYSPVLPRAPPTIIAFSPKERSKKGRKEKKERKRRKERKKEEKKTSLICEVTSLCPSSWWLHQPTTTANMLAFNHGQPKCTFIAIKPDDMQQSGGHDHQALRTEGVLTGGHKYPSGFWKTPEAALHWPERLSFLPRADNVHELRANGGHCLGGPQSDENR